jgi:hypothetical protein
LKKKINILIPGEDMINIVNVFISLLF